MKISIISFTNRGESLANRIAARLRTDKGQARVQAPDQMPGRASGQTPGQAPDQTPDQTPDEAISERSGRDRTLSRWAETEFEKSDALIFVGATGIAVRTIAPFVRSKDKDPAVVVVDEAGRHAISLLSGHLGGANDLARRVSDAIGAEPVITTATDVNGVFAVDDWARKNDCVVLETEKIVQVSGALLAGRTVTMRSRWPVAGEAPEGIRLMPIEGAGEEVADVSLDMVKDECRGLHLVPRICFLGIGCRRGTSKETIREALEEVLLRTGLRREAIAKVASIELKKDEEGLVEFCEEEGWPFVTYTVEELMSVPGEFTASDFVLRTTGADNICERSAVRAAEGKLILKKYSRGGVTIAIAKREPILRWQ